MNHLNTHTLLLKSQHDFTKGKSCLTYLLLFLEDVAKAIDEGKPLDVIYLDFGKAIYIYTAYLIRCLTKDFSTKLKLTV